MKGCAEEIKLYVEKASEKSHDPIMSELYHNIVSHCSLIVGTIGLLVIAIGALRASLMYAKRIFSRDNGLFADIRLVLGGHIILGLDFLVGQDIMNTILLNDRSHFWQNLAELVIVVCVRIVLTYFMSREMRELAQES